MKHTHNVALLTPVGLGIHGQVLSGLLGAPELHEGSIRMHHFFTNGVQDASITPHLEHIMTGDYDLLITLGLACTKAAREVLQRKSSRMPHIFVGITEPARWGVVANNDDYVRMNMTGVLYTPYESTQAAEFLCESKPSMRNVLIAMEGMSARGHHINDSWADGEIAAIRAVCESRGVQVHAHFEPTLALVHNAISRRIHDVDTIFMLEGGVSMEMHAAIGHLCNQYKKTMFSGFLDAVRTSAAIGYGASYEVLGAKAAEYAYKILRRHARIATLPPVLIEQGRRCAVNVGLATQQDLDAAHVEAICKAHGGIIF